MAARSTGACAASMWLNDLIVGQYRSLQPQERKRTLLLSIYFFLIIATFWILKPLKRGVIIHYFAQHPMDIFGWEIRGAEAEQIAKILNLIAAYFAAAFFILLARRLPRGRLVPVCAAMFAGASLFYASVIDRPSDWIVWTFYIFGDMFNTVMVALFWAFTNDIATSEEARRTYGPIGLGGVLGGFLGATVVASSVQDAGRAPLLVFCVVPLALIAAIAYTVDRLSHPPGPQQVPAVPAADSRGGGTRAVLASPYLQYLAGIIACYELVSNIIDFQLAATIERSVSSSLRKDVIFGILGQLTGLGSIAVQLFGTGFVLRRFGVRAGLLVLPLTVLASAAGFLVVPTLLLVAAMSVSDNALNYSIHQSSKEVLYTPVDSSTLFQAKAVVDMFVQRFAKVLSVVLNLAFAAVAGAGVHWLSLVSICVLLGWIHLARRAAENFEQRTAAGTGA